VTTGAAVHVVLVSKSCYSVTTCVRNKFELKDAIMRA
jgi:hypothetical protein